MELVSNALLLVILALRQLFASLALIIFYSILPALPIAQLDTTKIGQS